MKKMGNKILAVIVLTVMALSLLPFASSAADVEDIFYEIADDEVTILGCDTNAIGTLVIPSIIENYPVTSIG